MINILIVGGGRGGLAMLGLFKTVPDMAVIGIVDLKPNAPAAIEAHALNIPVFTDVEKAMQLPELNVIFDVTGSEEAHKMLRDKLPHGVHLADSVICSIMYSIAQLIIRQSEKQVEFLSAKNKELQRLNQLDELTGTANRRCFEDYIAKEWHRGLRRQQSLSVIMADIDYFKDYNDTYGHQRGDDCLKAVAAILAKSVKRTSDLLSRYGGDEFAIVLPDTDINGALNLAEEIRHRAEELQVENKGAPSQYITASLGAASLVPSPESSPALLIALADKALYRAKKAGRNCVRGV